MSDESYRDMGVAPEQPAGRLVVDWEGTKVAVLRRDGELFAFEDTCPHQGASLCDGHWEGEILYCPWHSWRFDVTSGKCHESPHATLKTWDAKDEGGRLLLKARPWTASS